MEAYAVCTVRPPSVLLVKSSGRYQEMRAAAAVAFCGESPIQRRGRDSSSCSSTIFEKPSAPYMRCRRLPSVGGISISSTRSNTVIRSIDGDDMQAKRARDQQKIEDFMPDLDELDEDELQGFLDLELESTMDFETSPRHYEIMFLIHEKCADEVQSVIEKVQDFITENKGLIHRLNDWGMRSLAYNIKKASRANYVLMNIEINSQAINVLNSLFEKDERVIRHMVMSQKAAITEDSVPSEEYRPSRAAEEEVEEEDEYDDESEEEDKEEEVELVLQRE